MGAVAARAILGKEFKLTQRRGEWIEREGARVLATVHPSFVLIQPAAYRERWRETLFADLHAVGEAFRSLPGR